MPTALQVLVVGQVEDDASVRLGCPGIRTNAALLRAAREAHPGAHVRYRPHPDVVTGNRRGHVSRELALDLADEVVTDVPLAVCLAQVDVVHTLTSLVGFEALLRGLRVVVHGQPFYAGWGLTEDREPHPRRTRVLSLDELVHGALIRYPRYVSPATGGYTTPEAVVEQLRRGRDVSDRSRRIHQSRTGRLFMKALNLIRTMRHAP
jgi:capsular polysaccharide export protein